MTIRVVYKSIRQNNSTNWYNREGNSWRDHSAFNAISKSVNSSNPTTLVANLFSRGEVTVQPRSDQPQLDPITRTVGMGRYLDKYYLVKQ